MMVDPQIDSAQQMLEGQGQHTGGSHVHSDDGVAFFRRFLGDALIEPAEVVSDLGIVRTGLDHLPHSLKSSNRT